MFEVEEIFGLGDIAAANADSRDAPDCVVLVRSKGYSHIAVMCARNAPRVAEEFEQVSYLQGPATAFLQIEHGEEKVEAKVKRNGIFLNHCI